MSDDGETIGCLIIFYGVVQAFLIVLKLLGVVGWSWFLVFLPTWTPIAVLFVMFAIAVVSLIIVEAIDKVKKNDK